MWLRKTSYHIPMFTTILSAWLLLLKTPNNEQRCFSRMPKFSWHLVMSKRLCRLRGISWKFPGGNDNNPPAGSWSPWKINHGQFNWNVTMINHYKRHVRSLKHNIKTTAKPRWPSLNIWFTITNHHQQINHHGSSPSPANQTITIINHH